jgi:hypothetical protein
VCSTVSFFKYRFPSAFQRFPKPTTEADWERPHLYSRRVKALYLDPRDEWSKPASIEKFEKTFVNFLGSLFPISTDSR